MNTDIASKRYKEVLRVDVITNRKSDFLASHVPFKNLHLATKLTAQAKLSADDKAKNFDEEEIYGHIAVPVPDDRFTLVTGTNGAGKSHLIRWIANMMHIRLNDSEVVLFIKRNDNTLKGTIRQLLDIPEVQNIHDKDRYKRLVNASLVVSEAQLKNKLYYSYVTQIETDLSKPGDRIVKLTRIEKKRLLAFLQNDLFKAYAMREDGPIERLYAKVAGADFLQGNDVVAQFVPEDFYVTSVQYDNMGKNGADGKALRMAKSLLHDEDGMQDNADVEELAKKLAQYMNSFTDDVVQECAGLQAGDMQQIFSDIRKELCRQGKNLTILVEDITSFTGVNSALLQALMTPHTGEYATEKLCRINAIVGSTDGYYNDNFRDNFKERITQFVWVPGNIFENDYNRLYEFFARYLNTMSLDGDAVDLWARNGADPDSYPVHTENIGKYWDTYPLNDHNVSLYPFSRHAIKFLYDSCDPDKKTPRRIMQDIILPYVEEILKSPEQFPSKEIKLKGKDIQLRKETKYLSDHPQYKRLLRFMTVWGDETAQSVKKDGIIYIGGIAESIYKDLELPEVKLKNSAETNVSHPTSTKNPVVHGPVSEPETKPGTEISVPEPVPSPTKDSITQEQRDRLKRADENLSDWVNISDYMLNATATTQGAIDLSNARKNMNKFLNDAIDWESEGVPVDALAKIKMAKESFFVSFERQKQTSRNSILELPANTDTLALIEAFLKWDIWGHKSWNYPDSCDDLLTVQIWLENVKPKLIKAMMEENGKPINYFSYAAASEAYRLLLNNVPLKPDDLNFEVMVQGADTKADTASMGHVQEWKDLCRKLNNREGDSIRDTFLQYYNLPQGDKTSSDIFILDRLELDRALKKLDQNNLSFDQQDLQMDDPVVHRKKFSEYLLDIRKKIPLVVEREKQSLKETMNKLAQFIDLDELEADDITDLLDDVRSFYGQAESVHIPVKLHKDSPEISNINSIAEQIEKAIEKGQSALNEPDLVSSLFVLTYDPLKYLTPLLKLLTNVSEDINQANNYVEREKSVALSGPAGKNTTYVTEQKALADCETYLGGC